MNFAIYAHSTTPRHCVYKVTKLERLVLCQHSSTSTLNLQAASEVVVSFHLLIVESFSSTKINPLSHELRARRLLRGFDNNQLSSRRYQPKLRPAMTSEGEARFRG
jgi:hypothetical protein